MFCFISLTFIACNEYKGYKKTESGLYYHFLLKTQQLKCLKPVTSLASTWK
jgi:hypothetical protein